MGFQKQICLILCFTWLIMVKFCVLQMSLSKTQMFLVKKNLNSMNIHLTVFKVDSLCLHYLDFCVYYLLSVISKQSLKK